MTYEFVGHTKSRGSSRIRYLYQRCRSVVFCVLLVFLMCHVFPMLPVYLDCPFLIALSVFSKVYFPMSKIVLFFHLFVNCFIFILTTILVRPNETKGKTKLANINCIQMVQYSFIYARATIT